MSQQKIILVGGPTASGKSALALDLARKHNGTIINADASQIYAGLPILSAQPSAEELKSIPHELYGVMEPSEASSAGKWLALATEVIEWTFAEGRTPVVVGGTGLYFRALLGGLAEIPPIPEAVRAKAQDMYDTLGEEKFREALAQLDPESASRLARNDRQRLTRAYEVVTYTGKTLKEWHEKGSGLGVQGSENGHMLISRNSQIENRRCGFHPPPVLTGGDGGGLAESIVNGDVGKDGQHLEAHPLPLPQRREGDAAATPPLHFRITPLSEKYIFEPHLLLPPREELYAACDQRFLKMIGQGAVEEVREFLQRKLDPGLPAMKTIGVREIGAYLKGEWPLDQAISKAQQATRNYAKRQMTWFRNQGIK